jgi:hypothetical protein
LTPNLVRESRFLSINRPSPHQSLAPAVVFCFVLSAHCQVVPHPARLYDFNVVQPHPKSIYYSRIKYTPSSSLSYLFYTFHTQHPDPRPNTIQPILELAATQPQPNSTQPNLTQVTLHQDPTHAMHRIVNGTHKAQVLVAEQEYAGTASRRYGFRSYTRHTPAAPKPILIFYSARGRV